MLDSFDSTNPDDYTAGFPMHPHRGIETISYVFRGKMTHRDSLGNEDTISDGEVQWMTAGSGILHEEKLPASERLLGVQLWLNLAASDKWVPPAYRSVKNSEIEEIEIENGKLRLLAGQYETHQGYLSNYLPLDYYDIHLKPNSEFSVKTESNRSVMLFTLLGDCTIGGEFIEEKTAVKVGDGDYIKLKTTDKSAQVLFISSQRLEEPIAWGGPIVMNTREELDQAFVDLRQGTFLKKDIEY
jgi:redox-sensitive bicupin YhaK (pirin superfamily)